MKGRRERGLTLIEMVIALAILGAGLMISIELFAGGLRLGRAAEEITKATQYARMKMDQLDLKPLEAEGIEEGTFDETFRWRVETRRVELLPFTLEDEQKPSVELLHLRVEVIWKSGLREKSLSLESYRGVKKESDEKQS